MDTSTITSTYRIANDLNVNRMGFGAMRITGKGIFGPPADKSTALKVLQRAVELGVNFIDTADSYGPNVSEELIAEALHPYPDELVIATKGGFMRPGPDVWHVNGSAAHLQTALEGSLRRLKLDCIDLYQLHRIDSGVPVEETFSFLQKAQAQGKIKHIGLSEVTIAQIKSAGEYFNVASVQNMYSVDNRKWEPELNYCEENDIAFIPWYPMSAGNPEVMKKLLQVADTEHATPHQVALSWLLQHKSNILLIPGTSSIAHLEENMKAASIVLSAASVDKLNKLAK